MTTIHNPQFAPGKEVRCVIHDQDEMVVGPHPVYPSHVVTWNEENGLHQHDAGNLIPSDA